MEVFMLVGIPGAGKTAYANGRFPDHVRVSLDKNKGLPLPERRRLIQRYDKEKPLGAVRPINNRKDECVQMDDALRKGTDVVVDDTNLTKRICRPYIALARKHKAARVRAVFFDDFEKMYAQNAKRAEGEGRVPGDTVVEKYGELELPTEDEGSDYVCPDEDQDDL